MRSQEVSKRKTIIFNEQIECFQYNYMQHQQPEREILSIKSQRQTHSAEASVMPAQQIVLKDKAKDEAKTKLIAKSILSSSLKRLRRDQQQSNLMQEYMDSVVKMVSQLRFTRPSKLIRKDMSIQQIDVLIQQLKERMETKVNRSNLKKKAILEMMQRLESKELQNKEVNQQLLRTRQETTQRKKWLHYMMHFEENISKLEGRNIKMQEDIQSKELQLQILNEQIACKVSESAITKQNIEAKKQDIQITMSKQRELQIRYIQLSSKKIPYRSEMIRCMFQVGILCEQNYVYSLKKKHKWSEKCIATSQANEKFSRMYENLKDRVITIDFNKSLLIPIRTLSAIYIHCQSLVLGSSFISNYSYFSTEYKTLYKFQYYERYLNILVQKTRTNVNWSRMRDQLHQDDSQACKLRLVIDVRQEQLEFLRYIMQVFLEESGYCIHLGEKKLSIELKADLTNKEEDQQQLQVCFLKMDLQNLGA